MKRERTFALHQIVEPYKLGNWKPLRTATSSGTIYSLHDESYHKAFKPGR